MKTTTQLILSASVLAFITPSLRAATLLAWDFGTSAGGDISVSATTVEPGVLSSVLTRGSEFTPGPVSFQAGRGAFSTYDGYQRTDLASALANGDYAAFTVAADSGFGLSLSGIDIATFTQNSSAIRFEVVFSTDGFATSTSAGIVNPVSDGWSGATSTFSLSGFSALQNLSTAVDFRIAYYGGGAYQQRGLGQIAGANNDIAIYGSTISLGTVWIGGTNSDWGTGGNWNPSGVPAATASITFGSPGANGSVDLGAAGRTVQGLTFLSTVGTTIVSATQTLTLNHGASPVEVTVNGGIHAITAAVALSSDVAVNATSGQLTFSGGISGNRAVSLAGAGTLILGGANTYTGATSVTNGTLRVTGTLGNTALQVSGGTASLQNAGAVSQNTLTVSGTGSLVQTVANALSGTTALSLTGGTATLSQANNYSGGTTVSGGKLLATNAAGTATGSGAVTVQNGGTLGGSGTITTAVTVQPGGHLAPHATASGNSTLTLSGGLTISSGIFDFNFNSGNAGDKIIAGNINLSGTNTLNVLFPNGLVSGTYELLHYTGTRTDTSIFNVVGTSAVTYTFLAPGAGGNPFANSYALTTLVQTGTWTGGTCFDWDTSTAANWSGPAGSTYIDGQPVIFNDSGAASSPITIQGSVSPYSVTFSNTSTPVTGKSYTLGGGSIDGTATVTLAGSGIVTFTAPNGYTGGTFLNAGKLLISDDNQIGGVPGVPTANVTINGGTLQAAGNFTLNSNRTVVLSAGGGTVNSDGNTVFINGLVTGTGALTISGAGLVRMDGTPADHTYAGGTVINGTLQFNNLGTGDTLGGGVIVKGLLGTGPVTINSGGALKFDNFQTISIHNSFILSGNVGIEASWNGTTFSDVGLTTPSSTTLAADTHLTVLPTGNYGRLEILHAIHGAHALTVTGTNADAYNLRLSNSANDFSGGLILGAGVTVLTVANTFSTVSGGVVTAGPLGTGTVTLQTGARFGAQDGGPSTVANNFLIEGDATVSSEHSSLILDATGTTNTITFANSPTLTHSTSFGSTLVKNYRLQGTGFTLVPVGNNDELIVLSPEISHTGLTGPVILNGATLAKRMLVYDVGTLSASGNYTFGTGLTLNGAWFQASVNGFGMVESFTTPVTVGAAHGVLESGASGGATVNFTGGISGPGDLTLKGGNLGLVNAAPGTIATALTIETGGTRTLGGSHASGTSTFSGPIALTGNLTLSAEAGGTTALTGTITGPASTVTTAGDGTVAVSGPQTFDTLHTTAALTNVNTAFTGATTTVNADAATNFGTSQTLAALNIGAGAVVTLNASGGGFAAVAAVPEPGSVGLLAVGVLGLLAHRRRKF